MRDRSPDATALCALSFVSGVHFAVTQTSYFLVLEAFVSSQALSYFIALFFWLVGLLVGLNVGRRRLFVPLLAIGTAAYYAAWWCATAMPFASIAYVVVAGCSALSGLLPGHFFRFAGARIRPVRRVLFHENNGFLLGLFLALVGAVRFGGSLVAFGPLLGALAVLACFTVLPR
jgi:hypothetical protein